LNIFTERTKIMWKFAVSCLSILVGLACAVFVIWSAVSFDPEPASRCLDSKYRIFERGYSFSVIEDVNCLNG